MNTPKNPDSVHPPLGAYSHTIKVPPGAEWLVISGQVGADASGAVAEGAKAQSVQALRNVLACLEAEGMGAADLVKITVYITDSRFVTAFREARGEVFGESVKPTSTLLVIAGLAAPELLVEVEAWAAKG